ncbi:MAG: S8 family serine peptidase [Luteolibacter sp.]
MFFLIAPYLFTGIAFSQPSALAESQPSRGEITIVPNGINPTPNWGLEKIGEQLDDAGAYTYPDTTNPVRLYLIDTAVANPGDWIGENSNLDFEETVIIGDSSDPTVSSEFGHGTRMLSLVAGLQTGVAPGTPIKVINYDVYPSGATTTATKLSAAILEAVTHYQDSDPQIPSVICLASSSDMLGSSVALQDSVQFAVDEGITVVVSSGNSGADAANYIPAAYGNIDGVICVGASNASDQRISASNFGTSVDILAPGDLILAKDEISAGSFVLMQGTSPAAAIVAGSALAELSLNGSLTPAELEATLISAAVPSQTTGAAPVLRSTPTAVAHIALPDGFITDPALLVALAGSNFPEPEPIDIELPLGFEITDISIPYIRTALHQEILDMLHGPNHTGDSSISVFKISDDEIGFTFPIDLTLVDDQDLFTLRNGYTWRIRCADSLALNNWSTPNGQLTKTTASDGTVWITARVPIMSDCCLLRIEVAPPEEEP